MIVFGTVLSLYAQKTFSFLGKDLRYGIRGGMTVSSFTGNEHSVGKLGWLIGADFEIPIEKVSENFFIQPSLLIISKGDESTTGTVDIGGGDTGETTVTENAIYLEIPITAAYRLNLKKVSFVFNAGPYLAFGLGGKSKLETNATIFGSEIGGGYEANTFDNIKRFDCGLAAGIRIEFLKHWSYGVQYDFGFINLAEYGDTKNSAMLVSIGYRF